MTSSIIYSRINVKIESGKVAFADHISLEKGTCVGVHFIPFKDPKPEFPVEISIKNAQGAFCLTLRIIEIIFISKVGIFKE